MIRLLNVNKLMNEPADFVADDTSDIIALPTTSAKNAWTATVTFGSRCFVIRTNEVYRLASDDQWVLTPIAGNGAQTGGDIATDAEIQEMLDSIFGPEN